MPADGVQVDLWFWKRLASQRDIRQILSNIRQFRLKVVFVSNHTTRNMEQLVLHIWIFVYIFGKIIIMNSELLSSSGES